MPITVLIRNNATGEIREHKEPYDDKELADFVWTEGSCACDCNREIYFEYAGGKGPSADLIVCGTGKFSVKLPWDEEFDE